MIYKARGIVFALMFFTASVQAGWFGPNVDAVKKELADPYSAKFENVKKQKSGAVCGEVNYKNQYGAYVGRQPFVIWKNRPFIGGVGAKEILLYCFESPQCVNEECVEAIEKANLPASKVALCTTKECVDEAIERQKMEDLKAAADVESKEMLATVQKQCLSHLPDNPDLMLSCNSKLHQCRGIAAASERLSCLKQMSESGAE